MNRHRQLCQFKIMMLTLAAVDLGIATACIAWTTPVDAAEEQPAEVLAAQIRKQGFPCDQPGMAVIDSRAADKIVWKLECKNATYRVQPIPGRAAIVEKIN